MACSSGNDSYLTTGTQNALQLQLLVPRKAVRNYQNNKFSISQTKFRSIFGRYFRFFTGWSFQFFTGWYLRFFTGRYFRFFTLRTFPRGFREWDSGIFSRFTELKEKTTNKGLWPILLSALSRMSSGKQSVTLINFNPVSCKTGRNESQRVTVTLFGEYAAWITLHVQCITKRVSVKYFYFAAYRL